MNRKRMLWLLGAAGALAASVATAIITGEVSWWFTLATAAFVGRAILEKG